jgi:RNA polymerase sigma-70 factor, ECF subfamily
MEYLLMIYSDEQTAAALSAPQVQEMIGAYTAYTQALRDADVLRGANRLRPTSAATAVRIANGERRIIDGPLRRNQGTACRLLPDRRAPSRCRARLGRALSWCEIRHHRGAAGLGDVNDTAAAHRAAEHAARQSYGKLVAWLAARNRDVAAAEDALSEAFAAALATWPAQGVPLAPEAWLLSAARRRLIDMARRRRTSEAAVDRLLLSIDEAASEAGNAGCVPDQRLRLMFACAHPAIDPAMRSPLMLQTVLGLEAGTIAALFLVPPATMSQRLVRAKRRIREAGIPFHVPEEADLPARLDAVLEAVYAAFAAGWADPAGIDQRRQGLVEEALWLGRVLAALLPDQPEALGLLALMLHSSARLAARRDGRGGYVPLSAQDPAQWDAAAIAEAETVLQRASTFGRIGRFQLEAAVQSVHAARRLTGVTDWPAVVALYDGLLRLTGSPVVAVNRAVALAETAGAAAGLAVLDGLSVEPTLADYQPYWAARAALLARLGRGAQADAAYARALALEADPAACRFLELRRALLGPAQQG